MVKACTDRSSGGVVISTTAITVMTAARIDRIEHGRLLGRSIIFGDTIHYIYMNSLRLIVRRRCMLKRAAIQCQQPKQPSPKCRVDRSSARISNAKDCKDSELSDRLPQNHNPVRQFDRRVLCSIHERTQPLSSVHIHTGLDIHSTQQNVHIHEPTNIEQIEKKHGLCRTTCKARTSGGECGEE